MKHVTIISLSFLIAASTTHAMDSKMVVCLANYSFIKKESDGSIKKENNASKIKLLITPDEKHILIAKNNGIVSQLPLHDFGKEEILIEHSRSKHVPFVVAAERDGLLLVVSGGNYYHKDTHKSECYAWYNGLVRRHNFDFALQAMTLNKKGKVLAIADQQQDMYYMDPMMNDKPKDIITGLRNNDYSIDLALNPDGNCLAFAKKSGITLFSFRGDGDGVFPLKRGIVSSDDIKHIYYPCTEEIIYITTDNTLKKLSVREILEISEKDIESVVVSKGEEGYNNVSSDQSDAEMFAFWKKSKKNGVNFTNEIIIRRLGSTEQEYRIIIPLPEESYKYASSQECLKQGKHSICNVAVKGTMLVALATDGKLYYTKVFDKKDENKNATSNTHVLGRSSTYDATAHKRKNSVSKELPPTMINTSEEKDSISKAKKKSSPRIVNFLVPNMTSSTPKESPKGSPRTSRAGSVESSVSQKILRRSGTRTTRITDTDDNALPRLTVSDDDVMKRLSTGRKSPSGQESPKGNHSSIHQPIISDEPFGTANNILNDHFELDDYFNEIK